MSEVSSKERFNGLMIDCSRLMEPHGYYFDLIDFMADWGMNTLLLHFSDDHGCGVALPGFERIAMPNAFTAKEIGELLAHAAARGVEIIPELEVFGHTRFLTDRPEYESLYAGAKTDELTFNAVDPLNPETLKLMGALLNSVCGLFGGRHLHIGCDEVDLKRFCEGRGLDEEDVWVAYVNKIIGMVRERGRVPMMWADHPTKSPKIASLLRKDVVLVDWRYWNDVKECVVRRLRKAGFGTIICAPAIAWCGLRFFPSKSAFVNTTRMCRFTDAHGVAGLINTVWVPFRYFQASLYYAMAYSARCAESHGATLMPDFRHEFGIKMFGVDDDPELDEFLKHWVDIEFDGHCAEKLSSGKLDFKPHEVDKLERASSSGHKAFEPAARFVPKHGKEVFDAMLLSARAAWVCSEYCLLATMTDPPRPRVELFNSILADVKEKASAEWDRTRFPDDPQKLNPKFGQHSGHALCLLEKCAVL